MWFWKCSCREERKPNKKQEWISRRIVIIFNLSVHLHGFVSLHYEEENRYKPVRVSNSWSNNYIECKSNGGRNKTPSLEGYLNKVRVLLKEIINDLKKSDTENSLTLQFWGTLKSMV